MSRLLILFVRGYQLMLSPLLGPNKCRFQPTCSHYAIGALREWGAIKGTWLAIKRVGRCHPWGNFGSDPVPRRTPRDDQASLP